MSQAAKLIFYFSRDLKGSGDAVAGLVVSFASDYASWSHNKSSRWLETVIHLWMSIFFARSRHFLTLQKRSLRDDDEMKIIVDYFC